MLARSTPHAVIQPKPGIGDVIWHLPFIRAIAAVSPGGQVTFLAPPTSGARELLVRNPPSPRRSISTIGLRIAARHQSDQTVALLRRQHFAPCGFSTALFVRRWPVPCRYPGTYRRRALRATLVHHQQAASAEPFSRLSHRVAGHAHGRHERAGPTTEPGLRIPTIRSPQSAKISTPAAALAGAWNCRLTSG